MKKILLLISVVIVGVSLSSSLKAQYTSENTITKDGVTIDIKNNKPITGVYKEYRELGRLMRKYNYKDGNLDGVYKSYHYNNGKLRAERNFEDGKKDGVFKYYHENGNLEREENYINGELQ